MLKEVYLDNAAATQVDGRVLKAMRPYFDKIYANPSSFNDAGRLARKAVDQSRRTIARFLGAKDGEIIFTGSGTEANNLAILGSARLISNFEPSTRAELGAGLVPHRNGVSGAGFLISKKIPNSKSRNLKTKLHIITTSIEHSSVLNPIKYLQGLGAEVTYLKVDKYGLINLEELKRAIRPETILVSIIYANNEIGTIQPIKRISKLLKKFRNAQPLAINHLAHERALLFHVDACQAVGHLDVNVNNLGVDLMTLNSSKIHGPKGVGALYVKSGISLAPIVFGGGQEFNLRSGTENVSGIVGFAKAIEILGDNSKDTLYKNNIKIENLKKYLAAGIKRKIPQAFFNGHLENSAPHILSATIPNIESEAILILLDQYGIRASAGSACTSKDLEISHVLSAIGLTKSQARATLRFSLSRETTKDEVDYLIKILPKVIDKFKSLYPAKLKKQYYRKFK